jgi:hypothetical protein
MKNQLVNFIHLFNKAHIALLTIFKMLEGTGVKILKCASNLPNRYLG